MQHRTPVDARLDAARDWARGALAQRRRLVARIERLEAERVELAEAMGDDVHEIMRGLERTILDTLNEMLRAVEEGTDEPDRIFAPGEEAIGLAIVEARDRILSACASRIQAGA